MKAKKLIKALPKNARVIELVGLRPYSWSGLVFLAAATL